MTRANRPTESPRGRAVPRPLLLLSLLLAAAAAGQTPDAVIAPLRAMTFNLRYDNPGDGADAWPLRAHVVAGIIRFHGAQVVGTQEGLEAQTEDLKRRLRHFDSVGIGRDEKDGGERCLIYFDRRALVCERSDTFWLSPTPEKPSRAWGTRLNRIVTWAELTRRSDGVRVFVFNTHFDHQSQEARLESARLLVRRVGEIAGDAPVIVLGDLNCGEGSPPWTALTTGESAADQRDAKLALRDVRFECRDPLYGSAGTWTDFDGKTVPGRLIDFIMVRNAVRVLQYGIVSEVWNGRLASDHRPVLAEVLVGVPGEVVRLDLSHDWRFSVDVDDQGLARGWEQPDLDDATWAVLHVGPWETQGVEHDGLAFYRKRVAIPATWRDRVVRVVSYGVDDAFRLYLNGAEIARAGRAGETESRTFRTIELPAEAVRFGATNLVVFRVEDFGCLGGLTGAPILLEVE